MNDRARPLKQRLRDFWSKVSRKTKIRVGVAGAIVLLLVLALNFLPSFGLRYGVTEGLRSLGMADVKLKQAEVALFGGRVGLQRLDAMPPKGPNAGLDAFDLVFAWRPLLSKRLVVEKMSASGIDIEVIRQPDGGFVISGLPVPTAAAPASPAEAEKGEGPKTPWGVGIEEFNLANSNLIYREGDVEIVFKLQKLTLSQLRSWEPKAPAKLDLQATLNGALIAITGDLLPFDERQSVSLNVNVNELDLGRLAPLLKIDEVKSAAGLLIAKASIDAWVLLPASFAVKIEGDVGLEKAAADTAFGKGSFDSLLLEGVIRATGSEAAFNSKLTVKNLTAETGDNKIALDRLHLELLPLTSNLASNAVDMDWTGNLALDGLKAEAAGNQVSQSKFLWAGQAKAKLGDAADATLQGNLSLEEIEAQAGDIKAALKKLVLDLVPLKADKPAGGSPRIDTALKLAVAGVSVEMPDLKAEQAEINWAGDAQAVLGPQVTARLDGELSLSGSAATVPGSRVDLASTRLGLRPLAFRDKGGEGQSVDWQGTLQLGGLKLDAGSIKAMQETVGLTAKAGVTIDAQGTPTGKISAELKTEKSRGELADLGVWVEQRLGGVKAEVELIQPADKQLAPARAQLQVTLDGLAAGALKNRTELLSLDRLALQSASFEPSGALDFELLRLVDLKLLQRQDKTAGATGNYPWRLQLGDLKVSKLGRNAAGDISIDRVTLEKLQARVSRTAAGLTGLSDIPTGPESSDKPATAKPAQPAAHPAKSAPPTSPMAGMPQFALKRFELIGDNKLLFEDRALQNPLRIEATPIRASISGLDSRAIGKPNPVNFELGLGQYGSFKLSGTVQPFDPKLSVDLKAAIKEFDLPPFSPYVSEAVGVHFLTGQLSGDIDVKIKEEIIAGESKLRIANLFLDDREAQDNMISKESGMPIDTALGLLRDENDNIDISIPLGGNLQDPQFDLSSTISKAIGAAVRGAALATIKVIFPPALLISAVASNANANPRLKPLEFEPSSGATRPDHGEILKPVAELMTQRPTLKVRVCGVATRRDWDAMQAAQQPTESKAADKDAKAKPGPSPSTGGVKDAAASDKTDEQAAPPAQEPDREVLEQLALLRSSVIKQTLVTEYGIATERLFECRPSIQLAPDALPRVDMRL